MQKELPRLENFLAHMTYASLVFLALGLVTSISILSLYHILITLPAIFFLIRLDYKNWSVSAWALFSLAIVIVLSIVFNQDLAVNGYKSLGKVKYFVYGILAIAPLTYYLKNSWSDRKISILIYVFFIATTFATLVGLYSRYMAFNPITFRSVDSQRNAGLFGMVMNYAHNLAYFQILVVGAIAYRKHLKRFISSYFILGVFIINLVGLYLTYTRGAWLGFLSGVPFFLVKNHKKWFFSIVISLVIMGGIVYIFAGDHVIRPRSDNERLSQWQAAIMAFKERPLLGYGYLNFEHHSVEIKKRYDIGQLQFGGHAHGNLFEMLASTGLLGFLAFCVWIISWFVEMYKRNDIVAALFLPFIVVFFVSGLTQSTIALGINLFFVMGVYSLSQVKIEEHFN